jgi:hypothetical protein
MGATMTLEELLAYANEQIGISGLHHILDAYIHHEGDKYCVRIRECDALGIACFNTADVDVVCDCVFGGFQ